MDESFVPLAAPAGSLLALSNHELYVVTARHENRESGQLATWIVPATLVPDSPRVVAVLSPQNFTHELVRSSGRFVLNLLAEGQHELVPLFGLVSGRKVDKFAGLTLERTGRGLPVLTGTCGFAECQVLDSLDSGDRVIYLAEVVEQRVHGGRHPLRKQQALSQLGREVLEAIEEKRRVDAARDRKLMRRYRCK